jgi:hypothetical protein
MLTPIPTQMEKLDLCLRMWQLIRQYIQKSPDTTLITADPVKKKLRLLEKQIAIQMPPVGSAEKRPRSGDNNEDGNRPPPLLLPHPLPQPLLEQHVRRFCDC